MLTRNANGSQEDWRGWLRLLSTPGVGNETARKLLKVFGLPEQIFRTQFVELRQYVPDHIASALSQSPSAEIVAQQQLTEAWLQYPENHLIHLADVGYPPALLEIPDPPVLLYVKGRIALLSAPVIGVVGSRNATQQGIQNAEKFAESLSTGCITVSSGLAAGIDTAAHRGGLRGVGSTLAIVGTGLDIVYPARNKSLAHQIAEQGCLVSEYALGTPAIASNFPRRNRIISGLSRGVLVVEAAAQSGSLITARVALEQGREVFAIPGSIHSPLAKGCHQLIKQGAKLVESAQDIFDELPDLSGYAKLHFLEKAEHPLETPEDSDNLLAIIGYDPVHIDSLQLLAQCTMSELSTSLLQLELAGLLETLPGGMVQRIA